MALSQTEGDYLTLHEFVRAAHKTLERNTWDYLIGGTATETTVRRNRQAIDRLRARPRGLRALRPAQLLWQPVPPAGGAGADRGPRGAQARRRRRGRARGFGLRRP